MYKKWKIWGLTTVFIRVWNKWIHMFAKFSWYLNFVSDQSFLHGAHSMDRNNRKMLVLTIFLMAPYVAALLCKEKKLCLNSNTKLLGVPFLDILVKDLYLRSCAAICMFTTSCVGVTFEPGDGMCHLYDENASLGITAYPYIKLGLLQATGVPCIRVCRGVI